VDYKKLSSDRLGESSTAIRERVQAARDIQNRRFAQTQATNIVCNADMRVAEVRKFCKLDKAGDQQRNSRSAADLPRFVVKSDFSCLAFQFQ